MPATPMVNKYEADRPDALALDEPFFFMRAQDALAPFAVQAYANLLHASGVAAQDPQLVVQAQEVHRIAAQMLGWQARNPTKIPD